VTTHEAWRQRGVATAMLERAAEFMAGELGRRSVC